MIDRYEELQELMKRWYDNNKDRYNQRERKAVKEAVYAMKSICHMVHNKEE